MVSYGIPWSPVGNPWDISVRDVMQLMLDICSKEADNLDFSFNTRKFVVMRIEPRFRHICAPLTL